MIRPLAIGTALALCALLAGCPESVHPLSDPSQATPDPALYGVWHGTFDGDEMYLHAGAGDRGMLRAVQVEHKKRGIDVQRYAAFPTRLERLAMLNVRSVDDGADYRGYWLFRYEVKGRKLTLWLLSRKAVHEDIRAGKLSGKTDDEPGGEVLITASSEELARYLQEGDPKRLFDTPLVFRQIAER